ncbi:FtsX-like permease family protein [Ginsengibacter hankyongi]|uniref:FtsX-like permease family protein n=1 Tax=Ginsengibacter hankyongi TaxID=2607284 RepID=A0A5J5IIP1_9BACT|nr:ABC transporter permease [Ginsengibacter hankyongi]KAA9040899.1 FtsX-like permease family protein [Ginsengibacter hankyongi]
MFKNYLKTALRNLRKNKLYSIINIFGLTVGLAACLLIGVYIHHELSYDKFNANAGRIVRATMEYSNAGTVNKTATTGTKVGPHFKRTFPLVKEYARTFISHNVVKGGDKIFDEPRILYADEPFFKIFSFHIIEGDAATALDAPDKIVITQSMAKKYFGDEDPVGKTLTSGGKDLRVSAVCEDVPQNSQIKFDFATQFYNLGNGVKNETWWTANWITYFLLSDEKSIASFHQQVSEYMKTPAIRKDARMEGNDYLTYHFEPLTKVHLYSSLAGFEPNGSITYIYMFSVIALLILIIACANYTNLATAQSAGRSGEIGIRKVIGATKRQIFVQFMSESSIITFIAAALALLSSIFLIPYFNAITGRQFNAGNLLQPLPIVTLVIFSLLVSFFAGLYPALVLSGTQVIGVLKKGFSFTGGNNFLRKVLIVAQFGISVFLIIYTVIILQQMHYLQTKNLGYDKDHVVVLPIGGNMLQDFQSIKNALALVPGVTAVTASYETPEHVQWGDGITAIDERGEHNISLNAMPVDLDFTKTMKMQLLAGRDFQQSDFAMMDTNNNDANYHLPYIINETLARTIGWTPEQAIGKIISKGVTGPVIGVIKDFNFSSLHEPIGPLLIFLGRGFSRTFMLRLAGNDMKATLGRLEAVWKQRIPGRPFTYHFLDDDYNNLYLAEQRSSLLLGVAATLAIVLACLGLFGLAAFTTVQRTKEIGIRRVLGADISSITFLIAKNFLQLIGIAILIAIPLAWWAGNKWLQDFAFRIPVQLYIFIVTAFVTAFIALCTVGYHSVKVALSNPVKSLKSE